MGVWAAGLYSGDFAMDLRSAVKAVAQLPFEPARLLEILCSVEPGAANQPDDPDHTVFWLVVADQFARRGIDCEPAREKALAIIDRGDDLAMLQKLGMDPASLKKRGRMLAELRQALVAPVADGKVRKVLKKPQELLMQAGDVLVYPASQGDCINPYFPSIEKMLPRWSQDGWSAVVIVECGRLFDFLAWYRPLTIAAMRTERPQMPDILANPLWVLKRAGTCSAVHMKKMQLEKIGTVVIDPEKINAHFPQRPSAKNDTISDISIANRLTVGPRLRAQSIQPQGQPQTGKWGRKYESINSLHAILKTQD